MGAAESKRPSHMINTNICIYTYIYIYMYIFFIHMCIYLFVYCLCAHIVIDKHKRTLLLTKENLMGYAALSSSEHGPLLAGARKKLTANSNCLSP